MLKMFTPTDVRVLIKDTTPAYSPGGISLNATKMDLRPGKVIKVGPGRILDNGERAPVGFKEGDDVIFVAGSCSEVTFEDKTRLFLGMESVVLGVVDSSVEPK